MSKQWLIDLIDEYTTANKRPAPERIRRLDRLFVTESPAAMQLAVLDYMRSGGRFFPRVADLTPYVTTAAQLFDRLGRPDVLSDDDRARVDEVIYSFEVSAGTIDPLASAAAEDTARRQLEAWGKCQACRGWLDSAGSCLYCDTGTTAKETAVHRVFKRSAADGARKAMAAQ